MANQFCFRFVGDQFDGSALHVSSAGLHDSQNEGDITQDEVINHANEDDCSNLQLSALQEYLSMIDNEDEGSDDET